MLELVIPDVHGKLDRLLQIEKELFPKAERLVFLGDFFDSFDMYDVEGMCKWIAYTLQDKRSVIVWANHDAHYCFKHPWFRCTGYSYVTQAIVDMHFKREHWDKFKLWTRCGNGEWLVSHAGFTPETIGLCTPAHHEEALLNAWEGNFHDLWMPGEGRGGPKGETGGPTWLDWKREFKPVEGLKQIVGHSRDRLVRVRGHNYCLDTSLNHVMFVEGPKVEIVALNQVLPQGAVV